MLKAHLKACNDSWKVDETYIKIKKVWMYLYRLAWPPKKDRENPLMLNFFSSYFLQHYPLRNRCLYKDGFDRRSIVPPLKNGEFGDSFVEYALLLGNVKSAILLKRKLSSEASEQSFAFSPPFT